MGGRSGRSVRCAPPARAPARSGSAMPAMQRGAQRTRRSRCRRRCSSRTRPGVRGTPEEPSSRRSWSGRARCSRSPRPGTRCSGDRPLVPGADPSPDRWPPRLPRHAGERRCPSPDAPGCAARCSLAQLVAGAGRPVPASAPAAGAAERVVFDMGARCGAGEAPRIAFGAAGEANHFAVRRHDRAAWRNASNQGSCRVGSLAGRATRSPPVGTAIRSVSRATDAHPRRPRAVCASSRARSVHRSFRTGRGARCAVNPTAGCARLRFPE